MVDTKDKKRILPSLKEKPPEEYQLNDSAPFNLSKDAIKNGNGVLSLLDGASSQVPLIIPEIETQKIIATDRSQPLEERLEAFDDIIDSEIGDTNLTRARNIEREIGLRQIYFKFDGGNPTGTQKDRIAFAQAQDALRRGFDTISVATCGNYGVAISLAASMAGLKCIVYIPETYHTKRIHDFFSGKIEEVKALRIAYLGTDSAVGKRTSALILTNALNAKGFKTEMIGTGQTSWMQGIRYSIIFDALVNDFVSGEIEHIIWQAWNDNYPEVIIIEGQGSIMNPAYPGGFEILAAGRPDIIILQHVPGRVEYDGFPGYLLHPLEKQINVLELLSDKPVVAVTINHEGLKVHNP